MLSHYLGLESFRKVLITRLHSRPTTMNTRDEFRNVSVMEADAALNRDAYAMSHWLGMVSLLPAAGSMQAGLADATADGERDSDLRCRTVEGSMRRKDVQERERDKLPDGSRGEALVVVNLHLPCVVVQCDGQDFTARIRELKFHCLLFLNIPKYVSRCST